MAYPYLMNQLLIVPNLECPSCNHEIKEVVSALKGRDSIPCPLCDDPVDIRSRRAEIDDLFVLCQELDVVVKDKR
jgi:peptide subunit release factor 1 (eRF1)